MEIIVAQLIEGMITAYQNSGWLAAFATFLTAGVGVYRLKFIQDSLPKPAQWAAIPMWARYLVPFLLAAIGSLIISLLAQVGAAAAVSGAILTGLASIGLHKGGKLIGKVEAKIRKLDPATYKVTPARHFLSVVVPVDKRLHAPVIDQD